MDEDTTGHVDNICQFVAPGKVVLAWEDNEQDPQYERSKAALDYLESQTDAKGRKLEVVKIHVPNPITITKEESEGVDECHIRKRHAHRRCRFSADMSNKGSIDDVI